jgi:hypothetical protein
MQTAGYRVFDAAGLHGAKDHLSRRTARGFVFTAHPGNPLPDAAMIQLRDGGINAADIDSAMRLELNFTPPARSRHWPCVAVNPSQWFWPI